MILFVWRLCVGCLVMVACLGSYLVVCFDFLFSCFCYAFVCGFAQRVLLIFGLLVWCAFDCGFWSVGVTGYSGC